MAIRIITDSTSDLPKELVEKHNLTVLPLKVIFGNEEFVDGIDLKPEEFYEKLIKAEELPTTAQVTPEQFIEEFEEIKKNGDQVICVLLGSKMSGTCQSAYIAKEHVGYEEIYIVDTNTVTITMGRLAIEAARMVEAGKSANEIVEHLEQAKSKSKLYAVIGTLKYLRKGGRLKASTAVVGEALNLKPVITINDGLVDSIGKARGMKKAFVEIKKMLRNSNQTLDGKEIYIGHAHAKENLEEFKEFILKHYKPSKIVEVTIGSVVGTHAGPGCVALVFQED